MKAIKEKLEDWRAKSDAADQLEASSQRVSQQVSDYERGHDNAAREVTQLEATFRDERAVAMVETGQISNPDPERLKMLAAAHRDLDERAEQLAIAHAAEAKVREARDIARADQQQAEDALLALVAAQAVTDFGEAQRALRRAAGRVFLLDQLSKSRGYQLPLCPGRLWAGAERWQVWTSGDGTPEMDFGAAKGWLADLFGEGAPAMPEFATADIVELRQGGRQSGGIGQKGGWLRVRVDPQSQSGERNDGNQLHGPARLMRAGLAFSQLPRDVDASLLTAGQIEAIFGDPSLIVEWVAEPRQWIRAQLERSAPHSLAEHEVARSGLTVTRKPVYWLASDLTPEQLSSLHHDPFVVCESVDRPSTEP